MAAATVLVVDEHPEILTVAKAMLARASYDVLTAANGEQALEILETQAHVDLVVSEVLMSGMSGPALVGRIKEYYPSIAVLLMTGFAGQPLDPAVPVVEKPFTAATLVRRVQQVLAESRRVAEALQRTFETSLELKRELESVARKVRENLRQSRRKRSERFCSRLREPDAVIPTVLVVEDDPALRYAVCHFLSRLGFTVLEAPNGRQALELSREHRGRIEMLVTDLRIPGLGGLELAKAVGAERPQTSVVFMTAEDIELPHAALRKPFELDDLLATIVGILSSD